jgi:tRNA-dihydrouridine synthase 4
MKSKLLEGPILAPMVRAGFCGMRMLCLDYGASCVFTDVVIASNLTQSSVFECEDSILYVRNNNRVLRLMKRDISKTIVQLASCNIEHLLRATEKVAPFCAGVDINCGCTKDWTHSCMGAGLLKDTKLLVAIASSLSKHCKKLKITSSAKIRLLDTV